MISQPYIGAQKIKSHPFFSDVNWEQKLQDVSAGSNKKGLFVPKLQTSVDTCYFKDRLAPAPLCVNLFSYVKLIFWSIITYIG